MPLSSLDSFFENGKLDSKGLWLRSRGFIVPLGLSLLFEVLVSKAEVLSNFGIYKTTIYKGDFRTGAILYEYLSFNYILNPKLK